MNIVLLILAALILPATMVVLSISMNEFEKNTRALSEVLVRRYTIEPKTKSADQAKQMAPIVKLPGKS